MKRRYLFYSILPLCLMGFSEEAEKPTSPTTPQEPFVVTPIKTPPPKETGPLKVPSKRDFIYMYYYASSNSLTFDFPEGSLYAEVYLDKDGVHLNHSLVESSSPAVEDITLSPSHQYTLKIVLDNGNIYTATFIYE